MADNEIIVSVGADNAAFLKAMKEVKDSASKALGDAGKKVDETGEKIDEMGGKTSNLGDSFSELAGTLASAFSFSKFIGFLKDSVVAADEQAMANARLSNALRTVGDTSEETFGTLSRYATQMQKTTLFTDDAVASTQAILVSIGRLTDTGVIDRATKATADYAAANNMDIVSAADAVAKAANGNIMMFTRLGLKVDENATSAEKFAATLKFLEGNFGGAAEATANATSGTAQLGKAFGELEEKVGNLITRAMGLSGVTKFVYDLADALDVAMAGQASAAGNASVNMADLIDKQRENADSVANLAASYAGLIKDGYKPELSMMRERKAQIDAALNSDALVAEGMQRLKNAYKENAAGIIERANAMRGGKADLDSLSQAETIYLDHMKDGNIETNKRIAADKEKAAADLLAAEALKKRMEDEKASAKERYDAEVQYNEKIAQLRAHNEQETADARAAQLKEQENPFLKQFRDAQTQADISLNYILEAQKKYHAASTEEQAKFNEDTLKGLMSVYEQTGELTAEGNDLFTKLTGVTPERLEELKTMLNSDLLETVKEAQVAIAEELAGTPSAIKQVIGLDGTQEDKDIQIGTMDDFFKAVGGSMSTFTSGIGTLQSALATLGVGGAGGFGRFGKSLAKVQAIISIAQTIHEVAEAAAAFARYDFVAAGAHSAAAAAYQKSKSAADAAGSQMAGPGFAEGGIVGGNSFSGDKVQARLNSGEGVLTASTVSSMIRDLSGGAGNPSVAGGGTTINISIMGDALDADGLVAKISDALGRATRAQTLDLQSTAAA